MDRGRGTGSGRTLSRGQSQVAIGFLSTRPTPEEIEHVGYKWFSRGDRTALCEIEATKRRPAESFWIRTYVCF